jgi:hypothetical protein
MALRSYFDSIASVLTGIARRHGMEAKLLEHKLLTHWPEIAGEPVASHAKPDHIRFKKLYLVVENSVWLQHLTFLKPELIAKINAAAGSAMITDVVLRVGQVSRVDTEVRSWRFGVEQETPTHELPTSNLQPPTAVLKEAEAHAAAVTDPELRARLAEVMAHALSQQPPPSKR